MKIRYYMRGLGIGILVTSIFFMVSGKSSQTMSDEMVKARARELGMTESVVLAELPKVEATDDGMEQTEEISDWTKETEVESAIEAETTIEVESTIEVETAMEEIGEPVTEEVMEESFTTQENVSEKPSVQDNPAEESSVEETVVQNETLEEEPESTTSNTEPVTIVVNRGNGSDTVSKRLQEAGLVADAYEYDKYLMANGYDKRIGAGEHTIPAGATWEEIAKILCNMK